MKELTIEEKTKHYNEALERAKSVIEQNPLMEYLKKGIEYIFPELKESKDERIRKKLLSSFKDIMADADEDELWYGLPYNDIISWLEKQGNNINCIYDKELSELLHIVICRYVNDPDISYIERENVSKKIFPYVELLEKQGEQKPTIFIPKFRVGDIVKSKSQPMLDARKIISIGKDYYLCEDRGCIGFAWEDDCELVEPKQEWSEEDEKMFNKIAVHLNATCSGFPEDEKWANEFLNWFKTLKERVQFQPRQEWSEEDKNMLQSILDEYKSMPTEKRNWLKSLKERVQPQQKVEWSEEDETYSNHVITAIKSYYTDNLGEENPWREELLRWLKSLRPQLTWKPSKEQMITLRHVISGCSYDIDPLVELETKLKEL